jgi:hypothetical protein
MSFTDVHEDPGCALCMLVIGFSETLIFALDRARAALVALGTVALYCLSRQSSSVRRASSC